MSTLNDSKENIKLSQPLSEDTVRKVGCPHNFEREIIYGVQTGFRWIPTFIDKKAVYKKEHTYQPGDLITLRCPKKCPDIYIQIK